VDEGPERREDGASIPATVITCRKERGATTHLINARILAREGLIRQKSRRTLRGSCRSWGAHIERVRDDGQRGIGRGLDIGGVACYIVALPPAFSMLASTTPFAVHQEYSSRSSLLECS
jgi:hypothetical protein